MGKVIPKNMLVVLLIMWLKQVSALLSVWSGLANDFVHFTNHQNDTSFTFFEDGGKKLLTHKMELSRKGNRKRIYLVREKCVFLLDVVETSTSILYLSSSFFLFVK